jgi:DnaJ-class molecular chaperone
MSEPNTEDEADDTCGACNGTGWVPRDPDIGTEQECFVCDGTGKLEDEL